MTSPSVLHVLSQRPGRTGSGVTLHALVRGAAAAGWRQAAVVGTPAADPAPQVGDLAAADVHPVLFDRPPLDFPLPGMSDVMPYPSSRWSQLTADRLDAYRAIWRQHLARVIERVQPDVLHVHHLWLVGAAVKDVAPDLPVVSHVHGTGLRQMELCPHLAEEVCRGCARHERFAVLHDEQAAQVRRRLGVAAERVAVVGAGYQEELFHVRGRTGDGGARVAFVGKLSAAKGLPALLDAFTALRRRRPQAELHVAGSGGGAEAEALRRRLAAEAGVVHHGALPQERLADLLRTCRVCVLPSFYEGLPLVLAEALACGCRLVATRLPGIESGLAGPMGDALRLVEPPAMRRVDEPEPAAVPGFVSRLAKALEEALEAPPPVVDEALLAPFTWSAVCGRVQALWRRAAGSDADVGRRPDQA